MTILSIGVKKRVKPKRGQIKDIIEQHSYNCVIKAKESDLKEGNMGI